MRNTRKKEVAPLNPKELRDKFGLNQGDFWAAIGVTQSGGSRYENGRKMPKPVRELVRLVYELTDSKATERLALLRQARNPDKKIREAA